MSALPYMSFYVADYLADTSHISTLEHGAYLLLIFNYWQRGGPLPANDLYLARIARMTPDEWREARPTIEPFFTEIDGQWHHKRIDADLARTADAIDEKKKAGRASAHARAQRKSNTKATPVEQESNTCSTDVQQSGTGTGIGVGTGSGIESARALSGHREVSDAILKDQTFEITSWEDGFLANIVQLEHLTPEQETRFTAIADRWRGKQANAPPLKEQFYAAAGSADLEKWDTHLRKTTGRGAPRDSKGGWWFPSKLPPPLNIGKNAA